MVLSTAQLQTIQAHILASPDLNTISAGDDGDFEIATKLNLPASPTFIAWRTDMARVEIQNNTSIDELSVSRDWDWTTYKAQSVAEQGAWRDMFEGGRANFSKINLRVGVGKIHGDNSSNTKHALALSKRETRRVEWVLATGIGSVASPGTMSVEGTITPAQVSTARAL